GADGAFEHGICRPGTGVAQAHVCAPTAFDLAAHFEEVGPELVLVCLEAESAAIDDAAVIARDVRPLIGRRQGGWPGFGSYGRRRGLRQLERFRRVFLGRLSGLGTLFRRLLARRRFDGFEDGQGVWPRFAALLGRWRW